jgi:predicted HTH transcriptional regulator
MNPRINQRELSDKLSISLSTIKRVMTGMIQAHVLTRKGGKRYGYWEIEAKEQRVV